MKKYQSRFVWIGIVLLFVLVTTVLPTRAQTPTGTHPVATTPTNSNATFSTAATGSGERASYTLPTHLGSTTITHSTSQDIVANNSVACNSGGLHTENSYYRVFDLEGDFGITQNFTVNEISFGVEQAFGATGSQPLSVKLYTLNGILNTANLTLIGQEDISIADQTLSIQTVVMSPAVFVPAFSTLVVEIFTPEGQTTGNSFFIGSNTDPQTGPSYVRAPDCQVPEPTDFAELGFPDMHIVLNATGELSGPTVTPTMTYTPGPPTATPTATPIEPDINVQPGSITETHTNQGQTTTRTLSIGNTGVLTLEWAINEVNVPTPTPTRTPTPAITPTAVVTVTVSPTSSPVSTPAPTPTATSTAVQRSTSGMSYSRPVMGTSLAAQGESQRAVGAGCAPQDIIWLTVSPNSGSTAPGGSSTVTLTFDSTGLSIGVYTGTLCIENNDPDENPVLVPVVLNVSEPTAIDVGNLQSGGSMPVSTIVAVGILLFAGATLLRHRRR